MTTPTMHHRRATPTIPGKRPWPRTPRLLLVLLALTLLGVQGCCPYCVEGYVGPTSSHFDGTRFVNQAPLPAKGFPDFLRWRATSKRGPWQPWEPTEPGPAPPIGVDGGALMVTHVNHSTVLVQIDGVNILTDPIWSDRASPVSWAGPKRAVSPGIALEDLPPLDAVLISHDHYDHMDIPTLQALAEAHGALFLSGLGNAATLAEHGIEATDLDWWDTVELTDEVAITFVPAQHFSGRGVGDQNKTLWGGFVIEAPSGNVYFAGDTGWGIHFAQVKAVFETIRLAILPIGAFKPEWFMSPMHISPAQAVDAHLLLGAETSLAIHYGTFPLADDGQDEPVLALQAALDEVGLDKADVFWVLQPGVGRYVPPLPMDVAAITPPPPEN